MKYAFRLPAASELDLTGMENWLEEMALKGLYLKGYRSFLCCFTRGEPPLTCPLAVVYKKNGFLSPAARAFIRLIQDFYSRYDRDTE